MMHFMKKRVKVVLFLVVIPLIMVLSAIIGVDNNVTSVKSEGINISIKQYDKSISHTLTKNLIKSQSITTEHSNTPKINNHKHKKKSKQSYSLSANDKYLLEKIAMAEAEGESIKAKAFVILTVLNRVDDDKFPSNVNDVIFQKKQFSPIDDGRWNRVEPNKDCKKALKLVINGSYNSKGCLYFEDCSSSDNWHSRNLEYLFEVDGIRFYK